MTGRDQPGAGERADPHVEGRANGGATPPSRAVVKAVAQAADRDPSALEPLYEAIDPDALDAIYRSRRETQSSALRVSFSYASFEVTVGPTGAVEVSPVTDRLEAE